MKTIDMTADQIRACVIRCPIKLPKSSGTVLASSGDWFACGAKIEPMKPYWRAAKKDLRDRELRGGSYKGDLGRVTIGGKRFALYPKSCMLVRDDFALWCDAHADEVATKSGDAVLPSAPREGQAIEKVDPLLHQFKDIRSRALKADLAGLVADGEWNTLYNMKNRLAYYVHDLAHERAAKRVHAVTKLMADQLAALIAYREKDYANSVGFLLDVSATALAAAKWVQDTHSAKEVAK